MSAILAGLRDSDHGSRLRHIDPGSVANLLRVSAPWARVTILLSGSTNASAMTDDSLSLVVAYAAGSQPRPAQTAARQTKLRQRATFSSGADT